MTNPQLQAALTEEYQNFINLIEGLSEDEFLFRVNSEKWSNGENLDHILKITRPLNQALALPKFQLRLMFGKTNRPSKSYDELVKKYQDELVLRGRASSKYFPIEIPFEQRDKLLSNLSKAIKKLIRQLSGFSEKNLDTLTLPHPFLGKLSLREMMYFIIYHVQHHQKIVERNLSKKNN